MIEPQIWEPLEEEKCVDLLKVFRHRKNLNCGDKQDREL